MPTAASKAANKCPSQVFHSTQTGGAVPPTFLEASWTAPCTLDSPATVSFSVLYSEGPTKMKPKDGQFLTLVTSTALTRAAGTTSTPCSVNMPNVQGAKQGNKLEWGVNATAKIVSFKFTANTTAWAA